MPGAGLAEWLLACRLPSGHSKKVHESCTEQRWAALGLRWACAGLALGYGNWIYIGYKINVKLIYIGTGIW